MSSNWEKFVKFSIWISLILFCVRTIISWSDIYNMILQQNIASVAYNVIGYIGEAISASTILMLIYNKWAWKWKVLRWTHNVPVLYKCYYGSFVSSYDNSTREGKITICQTFLKVSLVFKTKESKSGSITASIVEVNSVPTLIYTYQNTPRGDIQEKSPIHYGTATFDISNTEAIDGEYYTGRKTTGHMEFRAYK